MKIPFLSPLFFLLLLVPFSASAQKWTILAKTGALWNSASSQPVTNQHAGPLSGLLAVGASRRYDNWEAGLSLGLYRCAYRIKGYFYYQPDPATGTRSSVYVRFTEPNTAVVIAPFVNRYFDTGRLSWYAGVSPFYANFPGQEISDRQQNITVKTSGHGFGLELHGGCSYRILESVTAFAEPAAGWMSIPGLHGRAGMFTASLGFGCRFKIR